MTATSRSMPGKKLAAARDRLGDRERVLEQPVPVGLVVGLRRRRVAEARPGLASRAPKKRSSSSRSSRVLDRLQQLRAGRPRAARPATSEPVARSSISYSSASALAQLGDLDLRPPALAQFSKTPVTWTGAAGGAERVERLGVLPADRLGGAGGVADRSAAATARRCACAAARGRGPRRRRAPAGRPRARAADDPLGGVDGASESTRRRSSIARRLRLVRLPSGDGTTRRRRSDRESRPRIGSTHLPNPK